MLHIVIIQDPKIFGLIKKQTEAKKVPLSGLPYQVFSHGNIKIIGEYGISVQEVFSSVITEFNPDTVFFLSESLPVSDEKFTGDIVLPNVFFQHQTELPPIFLEHYPLQGDYNFELFGFSVGGIHVSGEWDANDEDFRIQLRIAYENDTFDKNLYHFVDVAQKNSVAEKAYPVAYIGTDDSTQTAKNLWSIVGFVIGSIDPDLILENEEKSPDEEDGEENDEK